MSAPSSHPHIKQHESWLDESVSSIETGLIHKINPDIALKHAIKMKNNAIELSNSYNATHDNSLAALLMKISESINRLGPVTNTSHYPKSKDNSISISETFDQLDRDIEMGRGPVLSHAAVGPKSPCYPIKKNENYQSHLAYTNQGGLCTVQSVLQQNRDMGQWNTIISTAHPKNEQQKLRANLTYDSKDINKNENIQIVGGDRSNTRRRRPNHPKQVTTALYAWYNMHKDNPYPDDCAKKILQQQTGLNAVQLNNWFINARRRYRNH